MKEVTVQELKQMFDTKEDFQLIDVREPYEFEICDLGGTLIPVGTIMDNADKISKEKTVVIHCRSGQRSKTAIMNLEEKFGFKNLFNLRGGILAYADEIDHSKIEY
jgi:adenylyltransferase/sulfurtransferase